MTETTQVYQVLIKAAARQIWDAITKPEFSLRYFHGVRVETTGVAGTPFRQYLGHTEELAIDVTITESDPPHKLVIPWRALYNAEMIDEPPSRVSFTIDELDGGVCLLTVVHDQLEHSPRTAQGVGDMGWLSIVNGLKTLLETGQPLFSPAS